MNDELLKLKGRIADAEYNITELEAKAAADIVSIRNLADPFEDDLSKIKSNLILAEANSLHESVTQLKTLKVKLAGLKGAIE